MYSYQQNRLEKSLRIIENWRKTGLILVCLAALVIDSLFLFIPVIDSHRFCYIFDKKLGATACVLRTCIDTFYVILIFFHNFTQHIAPRTQVFRGELFVHSTAIRERCLFCHFIIDIISVLPIPQVVFLTFISQRQHAASLVSKQILKWIVLGQYIPRIIRIYPLFKDMTRAFATVAETKWIGAGLNLFLYMLQSCVFGGFWYLIAIEKKDRCWREACTKASGCDLANVYCARGSGDNRQFLNTTCLLIDPDQITNSTIFNFGIYIDALKSGMVESRDFPRKFFYCLWWGLRNVSALGQNLETSNSLDEILFAIIICVSGLILFAVLIGNVQKYLLSTTIRVEEMEEKRRDTEKWMYYRKLPETLKGRIRRSEEYKWRQTRGTEEETFLRNLPTNLRLETKRHIYVDILKRVPLFYCMDDRLLDALCDRLKMVLYTEDSYILREGEPIVEMLFIARGKLKIKRNGNYLRDGDFCGDDLLYWALESHTYHLPISGETIQVVSEVEGFVLSGDDLKIVLTENSHHFDSKQFQFIVRYYSRGWQMWAANLIQVQWWRHVRRKLSKSFCEEKCTLHNIKPGQNIR